MNRTKGEEIEEGEERRDSRRSQDVAGVTVIWNSPAPVLADVDVTVREEGKAASDEGMSWSPADIVVTEVDIGVEDDGEEVGWWEDDVAAWWAGRDDADDDVGGERRAWYQSRFCSSVSKMALASG